MSVLSDKTITTLCTPPTHRMHCLRSFGRVEDYNPPRPAWMGVTHTSGELAVSNAEELKPTDPWVVDFKPMIAPFSATSVKQNESGLKVASWGTSSYGYDLRAAPEFKLFKGVPEGQAVDYKNITDDMFETITDADKIVIPPHGFILTRSVERVRIPRGVLALCIGKSTIARVGINCLCTPIEPEWEGYITFEFHNTLDQPNTFYANEGVLQLIFLAGDVDCLTSYEDRGGKYQGQGSSIILPKV